jgi:hypothetical protein
MMTPQWAGLVLVLLVLTIRTLLLSRLAQSWGSAIR